MTYLAPLVTLVVAVIHTLSFVELNTAHGRKPNPPWYLHAYWLQYVFLGLLAVHQLHDMVTNVMIPSGWMDPAVTNAFVSCMMVQENECYTEGLLHANISCHCGSNDEGACFVDWQNLLPSGAEVCDSGVFSTWQTQTEMAGSMFFPLLRCFAITTPFWLIGTFVVCILHTREHSKKMKDGGLWENPARRMIIAVILLPFVWCLMCFCSVMRSWQVTKDHVYVPPGGCGGREVSAASQGMFHGFEERRRFLIEMYHVNFDVAGIYQAVCMFIFAEIITSIVMVKTQKPRDHGDDFGDEAVDHVRSKSFVQDGPPAAHSPELRRSATTSKAMEHKKKEKGDQVDKAYHTITALTMEGVLLFSAQSFFKGALSLFVTTMAFDFCGVGDKYFSFSVDNPGLFQQQRVKDNMKMLFTGVSLVASYNAMRHISTLQKKKTMLGADFKANSKCNTIKLLTSFESVQPFAIMFLFEICHQMFGMAQIGSLRNNLFVASLNCMEAFFISLMNLKAWDADEQWIDRFPDDFDEELKQRMMSNMNDPFHEMDKHAKKQYKKTKKKFKTFFGGDGKKKSSTEGNQALLG